MKKLWIKNSSDGFSTTNFTLKGKGFLISYNPYTGGIFQAFAGDNGIGSAETAIIHKNKFYILNGDFRKEYEKRIDKGYKCCKEFFNSKKEFESSWSN